MTTNPHEDAARARKVIALLGTFPACRTQIENDLLALFLESLSPLQRQTYEAVAGVKKCSDETWRQTIAAVRARHVPGDGGALDRRTDVREPDHSDFIRKMHRTHPQDRDICVACELLADELKAAFDAGVTAAVRAVGL